MNIQFRELITRRPVVDDAQLTLELIIACDIAEYGEADSDLGDLLFEWGDIDLEQDAWLLFTPEQTLAGYAAVFDEGPDFTFDFYSHPAYEEEGLPDHLIALCLSRAETKLFALPGISAGSATTIIPQVNERGLKALEKAGFEAQKYYFRMLIELETLPPNPAWPGDSTLRIMVPGQDDRLLYDFIQNAFDRPGRTPPPFDKWRGYMMREDHFSPELWFMLFHREELIGAALCYDYEDYGWVRQLGVSAAWRQQGLGSSLLRHVFRIFFQRGRQTVALGVDSKNPQAYSLYEKVGMACVRRYDEYHMTLAID